MHDRPLARLAYVTRRTRTRSKPCPQAEDAGRGEVTDRPAGHQAAEHEFRGATCVREQWMYAVHNHLPHPACNTIN